MPIKPNVVIYRDRLLPASETFILAQAEALQRFTPYYVGSRLKEGLLTPKERTLVVNRDGLIGWVHEVPYKLTGFAPNFFQRVRKLNPVLIHAHFGIGGVQALPLRHRLQVPMLVTCHGYEELITDESARQSFYSHRIYLRRREALKHEAQLFIAVSEHIKRSLLEQGFPPNKIVTHYIGVDTNVFQPDPTISRDPIVLFVGRLVEKKGCEYLIRAMAQVQVLMPDMELVIIGDGLLRSQLEELAAKSLRRYRFLGVQPPHKVRSWMKQALIFSLPSVTASTGETEGLPIVILEAQAMGLPVVSTIHSGIPEAMIHEETGFLASERDWEKLAEYIVELRKNRTLWQQFSQKGQERIQGLFSLQKQTGILEDIYRQVLVEKGHN